VVKNNSVMVNDLRQNVFDMSELFKQLLADVVEPLTNSIPNLKGKLKDGMDTSNFADEFTHLPVTD